MVGLFPSNLAFKSRDLTVLVDDTYRETLTLGMFSVHLR